MEQFGTAPTSTPQERTGAYGVTMNEGRLLVVEFERRLYLPGGGSMEDERPEDTLRREVLEETGYEIARCIPLGQAMQFTSTSEGPVNKVCAFFAIQVGPRVRNSYSAGHSPEWVPIDDAVPAMAEDASLWAVRQYLRLYGQDE